jgi:tRNA (mo5U34)-methyltransferase
MSVTVQSNANLLQEITGVDWFHSIDLGGGITTPGCITCMSPEQLEIGRLDGQTVLDIGAWDGAYSFMAERRGARRVLATDSVVWSGGWRTGNAGFKLARRVLKSKVEDMNIDVMDLSPGNAGVFDVVLFLGVLYHLRHPLLALERIFSVVGKQLILETHVDLADYPKPAMAFYPGSELAGDPSNWWGPNPPAVQGMLKAVGFREVKTVSVFRPRPESMQWWSPKDPDAIKQQGRAIFHAWK